MLQSCSIEAYMDVPYRGLLNLLARNPSPQSHRSFVCEAFDVTSGRERQRNHWRLLDSSASGRASERTG